jgi:hypothetical protein
MGRFIPPPREEPTFDHPLCSATMVCLRGPCQYYWSMISRLKASGTDIRRKHTQTCLSPAEETDLNEENVYSCSRWWPMWATWVPESIRPFMRQALIVLYEGYLTATGYDLSWKDWSDDTFEIGKAPDIRGNLKLGAKERLGK